MFLQTQYDNKQFKPALKNCDQVLEKHPDHPESLAMKALILNALKKKVEAFEFIKKALFKNLANFTCWHVYGILHRSNKNYDEARKAYLNALKYDPKNQNVLRDLGQLQIQLRDFVGYAETRRQILVEKSDLNMNWICYAVALYLAQDYAKSLEVLASFEKTLQEKKTKLKNNERSEMTIFEARVHEAMGNNVKAIRVLTKKPCYDQLTKNEKLVDNYIKQGNKDKAVEHLEELIRLNSSNQNYYFRILEAHGFKKEAGEKFNEEEQKKIFEIIKVYEEKLPKANAHQRVLLKVLHGDLFKQKVSEYARQMIVKGVPPLIKELKEFYNDTEKVKILEDLLLNHIKSYEANQTLSGEEEEQDPTIYLWLLYFTSQHYYFLRDYDTALSYVNKAIEHTPTVIELYTIKSKIYKRAGDMKYASQLYDEARKLDLADRYLNAVSSRYKIKAEQVKEAEEAMALFSKEGEELNVHDMQCMWYEVEVGNSYHRQGNYRMALKNFNYIEKHFDQIFEDQFDFHLYAIRKFTLNSYFQMLQMEDHIYRNKNAVNAAIGIIKTMNKISKIQEEETKRFQPEFDEYKNSTEFKNLCEDLKKRDEDDEYRNDYDPQGFDLYEKALKDPLGKALEFSSIVVKQNPDSQELHAKIVPLALKKSKLSAKLPLFIDKLLMALTSVQTLVERHPTFEKTVPMKLRFLTHWYKLTEEEKKQAIPNEKERETAVQDIAALGAKSEAEFKAESETVLKNNITSIEHVHEYIKVKMTLFNEKATAKFEELAINALEQDSQRQNKVEKAANLHRRLIKAGLSGDQYKTKAKGLFKYAKAFE